jgi:hypothetical protein
VVSGSGGRTPGNLSTPISRVVGNSRSSRTPQIEDAKTYRTNCWRYEGLVYYHTQGFGDCVLFDSFGCPWQVHKCWADYWKEENARRNFLIIKNPNQQKRSLILGATRQIGGGLLLVVLVSTELLKKL